MIFRWGKNPKFTFSIYHTYSCWNGKIALPIGIDWWYTTCALNNKNLAVSITFFCFVFELERWKWGKE